MLNNLRDAFAVILFWVFDLLTDLSWRFAFPNHRHVRWGQMPVWRTRRHVQAGDILSLMTGAAFLRRYTLTRWTASDILRMRVIIVTLTRKVAVCMTIETAWMF